MRRPRPLPPGGTLGVISPASPGDTARLEAGIAVLRQRGFQVIVAPHAFSRYGHMAGTDHQRAADFVQFYTNSAIDVLWCARGGSSSCRLWPLIDWDDLASVPPKIVIGYSDITSLQIPLLQRTQTVALHGPMVSELATTTPELLDWLLELLQSPQAVRTVPMPAKETLTSGHVEGTLCGGCLSLVVATLGTPYQIDAANKLVLMEDVDEVPHRIERYLVQLREAGILASAAGFVVGEATHADERDTLPLHQIWSEFLAPTGKPTVLGFPFGHVTPNYALPFGVHARLDADNRTLTLLETAFE